MAGGSRVGIGEAVSALRREFPDVSVSKLRFLESEGLVSPLRTPKGYRKYTAAHLDRIRYVLSMQRDHYLPLKVIAEHLDALDRGLTPPAPEDAAPRSAAPETPVPELESLDTGVRLRADELCRESGLSREDFTHAVELGLLPAAAHYSLDHLDLARGLSELRERGVPVRNARPVVLAVQRELDLHATALGQARRGESGQEFRQRSRSLAAALLRVHTSLIRSRL
jgi:DNA-binding transcriptional MerR regulator